MASQSVLLLLAISAGNAFFHAENSFFYTDCLLPEFDSKCVHMPQPWLIGLFFVAGVAIPVLVLCCIAQFCIACINSLRE
ncbi:hypothetical protein AAVH_08937 [Aphelenchoides avenae]|nr:hypothetical protein AAVH_08937 [Aphelenchus avenae]